MVNEANIIEEFVEESREHLQNIEEDFLELEHQKAAADPELVAKVFRAIHTIKGSSAFLGFTNIQNLAHAMESLLSKIRDGIVEPSSENVNILLKGVDKLNEMLADVEASNQTEIASIVKALAHLTPGDVSKPKVSISEGCTPSTSFGFSLKDFGLKGIPAHKCVYILKYDLVYDNAGQKVGMDDPIGIIKYLEDFGTVEGGRLESAYADLSQDWRGSLTSFYLVFSTVLEHDLIGEASGLAPENISSISHLAGQDPDKAPSTKVPSTGITELPDIGHTKTEKRNQGPWVPAPSPKRNINNTAQESLRIKLDVLDKLIMFASELVLIRNQHILSVDKSDTIAQDIAQRLDIVTTEIQETAMRMRMQPIGNILSKFPRLVRELGRSLGKTIEIEITGSEVELDKTILETLADPLTHIIRNCCDHGLELPDERKKNGKNETGNIKINACHEAGQIKVEIRDDGKGINVEAVKKKALSRGLKSEDELSKMGQKELLSLLFLPGFSTAEKVSELSGRGVGMDVVKTSIEKFGGVIDIFSTPAKGTNIHLRLPLTLAIISSLIVTHKDYRYSIPQVNLEELVCLYDEDVYNKIEYAGNKEVYRLRDTLLPMVRLSEILKRPKPFSKDTITEITEYYHNKRLENHPTAEQSLTFAVLKAGNTRFGLIIDKVLETEEIVVKPMHPSLRNLSIYSGTTVLGDGRIALILDVLGIARHAGLEFEEQKDEISQGITGNTDLQQAEKGLLLFRNGLKEQFAISINKIRRIESISRNNIEQIGKKDFITVEGKSTRIVRLHEHLNVSPSEDREEMFLLLPKESGRSAGVLVTQLIDIGNFAVDINDLGFDKKGIEGSTIIRDHMTLLLDLSALLEVAAASDACVNT